jgi:hypothetical protein
MFLENKGLVHLDLSHNGFRKSEIEIMNEGLKENHTLLGIHMIGNEVTTDSLGFFSINEIKGESDNNCSISHILSRISPKLDMGNVRKNKLQLNCTSNCWICEGWT